MDIFRSLYCSWYFGHYINDISMQSLWGKCCRISRWQEPKPELSSSSERKIFRFTSCVYWVWTVDWSNTWYCGSVMSGAELDKKCKTFIVTNESARQYLSSATGESGNSFKNNLILLSVSPTGLNYNLIFYNRRKPELCSSEFYSNFTAT